MKMCKYFKTNEENDHICKKCKKYNDCFKQDLYEPKEEEVKEEKPIWSADGIALDFKKIPHINMWEILEGELSCSNSGDIYDIKLIENDLNQGNIFKTKERAELERDRRECNYLMKKMACESREDNDWDRMFNNDYCICSSFAFPIVFKIKEKDIIHSFNIAYFPLEESAQKCLDYIIEKYGEERLKEIFGVRNV